MYIYIWLKFSFCMQIPMLLLIPSASKMGATIPNLAFHLLLSLVCKCFVLEFIQVTTPNLVFFQHPNIKNVTNGTCRIDD